MLWLKQLYLLIRAVTDLNAVCMSAFIRTAILNPHSNKQGCHKVLFITGRTKYFIAETEAIYKEATGVFPNIRFCLRDQRFHWQQEDNKETSMCIPVHIAEIDGEW